MKGFEERETEIETERELESQRETDRDRQRGRERISTINTINIWAQLKKQDQKE